RARGGHYLMVVKKNHPQMYAELALFFELPGIVADDEHYDRCRTLSKGHGRLETRTLECLSARCEEWQWAGAAQAGRREVGRGGRAGGAADVCATRAEERQMHATGQLCADQSER